jgi:hypothetical protein
MVDLSFLQLTQVLHSRDFVNRIRRIVEVYQLIGVNFTGTIPYLNINVGAKCFFFS